MENEPEKNITLSCAKKRSHRLFVVFGLLGGLLAVFVFLVLRGPELLQTRPAFTVAPPWVALFGVLLFIALLIGYLGIKSRRTAHLEQLTNALAVSNKQLLMENAERKESEQRIRTMAYYDCLTGLPNRVFYQEMLGRALAWAHRHKKTVAVLFIDLDNFKRVNDTYGHDVGDLLLRAVAEIITRCVRKSDYVARSEDANVTDMVSRLGGDEFLVLLSEVALGQDAARVARRILRELESPLRLAGHEVLISASIGIALFPLDAPDAESLLKHADVAMYHAKSNGRKNYQFYGECMNEAAVQRLQLEHMLQKAVEQGEFVLHFQPILSVAHRAVVGIEALVRWQHPARGILPPAEFLKLAEETGLIVRIGEWVLRAACAQNLAWHNSGIGPLKVAVNLSVRQFDQQELIETIKQVLKDSGLAPQYLELEITESAILKDPEKAAKKLLQLRELGVGISLDDFGTGYSSLSHLRRFPLDALKIDRSFVTHITSNEDDAAMVAAIIRMAHSLRLRVVAEGVETDDQLAVLRALGCDEVQGFLFSHPLSANECFPLLLNRKKL